MAESSGFWTTSETPTGHQVTGYTQAHHSKALEIAAAVGKREGVAVGYLNELKATVTGANTVSINSGGGLVDGKWYENTSAVSVNIPSSVAGSTRIDRIVIRATWGGYSSVVTRIAGVNSGTPTAPDMTRTSGTTYDIPIAQVLVDSSGNCTVTDERGMSYLSLSLIVVGNKSSLSVGDDKLTYAIPEVMDGLTIIGGDIAVYEPSTSGVVTAQAALDEVDIFTTRPVIAENSYNSSDSGGTRGVADTVVAKGQRLRIDLDTAGTDAKGLIMHMVLR